MDTEIVIIGSIVFTGLVGILVLVMTLRGEQQKNAELDDLHELLGGEASTGTFTTELNGSTLDYGIFARGSGKNRSTFFMLRIPMERAFHLAITEEGGFDSFAKNMGLAVEVQTGDREFDDRFYLSSPDSDALRQLTSKADDRKLITSFFNAGFRTLKFQGGSLSLEASSDLLRSGVSAEQVRDLAEQFVQFSKTVSQLGSDIDALKEAHYGDSTSQNGLVVVLLVVIFSCIGILIAGLLIYPALDPYRMFFSSLMYSVPLCAYVTYQLVGKLKTRSDGHKLLATILVFTIPALIGATMGLVGLYNGYFDESESQEHTKEVQRITYSKSDKSTSYYAIVTSWRPERATERVRISAKEYRRLQKRLSPIRVVTRSGALGFEWMETYEVLS